MATTATQCLRVVKNGGPITKDVYKAYYNDGTAASEDWKRGELLYLDAGVLKRIGTAGSAAQIDTDDTGLGAAYKRFIALEDHDSSAVGKSDYVSVQEIRTNTVLEVQASASSTTQPLMATFTAGVAWAAYKSATDVWGIDVEESGAKGIFVVVDKDSDTEWVKAESAVAGTAGSGRKIRATLVQALFL